jgi:hypothetical protein
LKPQNRIVAMLLVLAGLWGCRALPPAPPAAVVSQQQVLARLDARRQSIHAFQAKGRITYLSPKENYSGSATLAGKMPSTLKVVILDFLGRTILSFASDGATVQVLSPREGKLFTGPATPQALAAFIPPAVSLPQILDLMVGALPLSQGPPDRFSFDAAQANYRLEWGPEGKLQERLVVTAQDLYPVREEWYAGAPEPRFTAELGDFGTLAPDLPGKITLKTPHPQLELRLVYSQLHLNPPLAPADLILEAPPGIVVAPLGR